MNEVRKTVDACVMWGENLKTDFKETALCFNIYDEFSESGYVFLASCSIKRGFCGN